MGGWVERALLLLFGTVAWCMKSVFNRLIQSLVFMHPNIFMMKYCHDHGCLKSGWENHVVSDSFCDIMIVNIQCPCFFTRADN